MFEADFMDRTTGSPCQRIVSAEQLLRSIRNLGLLSAPHLDQTVASLPPEHRQDSRQIAQECGVLS